MLQNTANIALPSTEPRPREKQVLDRIKKRQTSGKMIKKRMGFTTKLAQSEVQDAEQAEAGAAYPYAIPSPAEWVTNPAPQPHWSTLEGEIDDDDEALSVSSEECQDLEETELPAKASKLSDCMKMVRVSGGRVRCLRSLYVCEAREALGAGGAGGGGAGGGGDVGSRALTRLVSARRRALPGQITLVLVDSNNEYKKGKLKEKLDIARTDLLVSLEVDTVVVPGAEELSTFVLHFTRALAEEPRKLAKRAVDSEAEFYMRGDNKHCVTVDQQGNGLSALWQQMLAVLPHSSLEASRALAAGFASPRRLAEALDSPEGVARVAELGVTRSAAPGARARRLGPELTHKLRQLFNTTDGNLTV